MHPTIGLDASNYVASFDKAFYFMAGVALFFIIGLTATMLYFIYRYNNKKNKVAEQIEGSTTLEVIWTVIPTLLALLMFYYGWKGWEPMGKAPANSLEITSVARMWNFTFEYENGKQSPDLVVPVNTPIKLDLVSLDVIHSIFIPAFRIKSDMVPGRKKMMWFKPEREGEYDLYCAEYCGLQHSYMNANVKVLSKEKYNEWYADTSSVTKVAESSAPGAAGFAIMKAKGCNACHSSDGSKIVGPSYLHLFGEKQVVIRDGKEVTITADEEYIKRSILEPNADLVKGYPKGLMQSYKGSVTDADIEKIIEYLKTLDGK
jgi:cytochrome c oxidase subunit 2